MINKQEKNEYLKENSIQKKKSKEETNICLKNGIIEEYEELFGEMRHLTSEEEALINKTIDEMSEDTGIRLF